jgi:hypothetical protein
VIGSGCSSGVGTWEGVGGIEAQGPNESAGARDKATAQQALVNETCYQLRAHGPGPGPGTPFVIPREDLYVGMAYEVPWSVPMVATRFVTEVDNGRVVRSWELLEDPNAIAGSVEYVFGYQNESALFASWMPGEGPLEMPPGVGLELPSRPSKLVVRWTYLNLTGGFRETDASVVKICAVPAATWPHRQRYSARDRKHFITPRNLVVSHRLLHERFFRTRHRLSIASPHAPARRQQPVRRAS